MATYRMFCPDCDSEGTTESRQTAVDLVELHGEQEGHDPDVEVLEE